MGVLEQPYVENQEFDNEEEALEDDEPEEREDGPKSTEKKKPDVLGLSIRWRRCDDAV
jgi:hypothetical protein